MAPRMKGSKGSQLSRSEVITVRLDPRLRHGVELASRKHRRTASSFIEWAIEQALKQVVIRGGDFPMTGHDVLERVWDVDEPDRFIKLALKYPEMLSHEEQVRWKLIRECGFLWKGSYKKSGNTAEWTWVVSEDALLFDRLREHWDTFKQVATGDLSREKLPQWRKKAPAEEVKDDEDDDSFP